MSDGQPIETSSKSYGASVALCMIFGVMGIHHFYLGNWVHGIFDLGLFIFGFGLLFSGAASDDPMLMLIGGGLIALDILHTLIVTILLLIGKVKDGEGRVVSYPGQF